LSTSADPASAIVAALAGAGTRLVFGVPGGGPNLDVVGAAAAAGLRFVLARGETAATIMAATYADLTGAPGAVIVTRGPGLASAVNGIAHAALDRLPLVVIADTVPSAAPRITHQRIDQDALGRSVAKAAITVGGPRAAAHAVRTARTAPAGPVVANMDESAPDLNDSGTPEAPEPAQTRVTTCTQVRDGTLVQAGTPVRAGTETPATTAAQVLAEALGTARRPVVLLGTGAVPQTTAVRKVLAGSGIPVLHTYRARGVLPDSAAEAAGLVTGGTTEWPLLSAADLIVALGVDEAEMIPAPWDYAARTILVTEDKPPDHGYFTGATTLMLPLGRALEALATGLAAATAGPGFVWAADAGRTVKEDAARRLFAAAVAEPGRLAPQQVVRTVRDGTPAQTIATVDAGAHMLVAMPLWEVPEPGRLLISSGLATMGYALPAAIAAALCAPEVPVVAFTGDGGLGMALAELETAVRLSLQVIVVVFNDAALSLIEIKQKPAGQGGAEAVRYQPVSFAAAATALGAAGAAVSTEPDLAEALAAALRRPGPTVIDASVDPACYPAVMDLTRGQTGRRSVSGISRASYAAPTKQREHAQ
jgi:acetolactate synthase-1/2/3 large subunit